MEEVLNWLDHYEKRVKQVLTEKDTYPALVNYLQGELYAIERTKSFIEGLTITRQL